jgi:hypothetical protein
VEFLILQEKIMPQIFGDTQHRQRLNSRGGMTIRFSETENADYNPDGIGRELKTLMQVNRLHKYLSARVCEFIFVLRKCYSLVKNDIIGKLFGKKNPFQEIEIPQAP